MKQNKKQADFKLTLITRLQKMSYCDYQVAMKWLPEKIGCHPQTFRRWIYMRADCKYQIPGHAILIMATFFDCKPHEMFTNQLDTSQLMADWEKFKLNQDIHVQD